MTLNLKLTVRSLLRNPTHSLVSSLLFALPISIPVVVTDVLGSFLVRLNGEGSYAIGFVFLLAPLFFVLATSIGRLAAQYSFAPAELDYHRLLLLGHPPTAVKRMMRFRGVTVSLVGSVMGVIIGHALSLLAFTALVQTTIPRLIQQLGPIKPVASWSPSISVDLAIVIAGTALGLLSAGPRFKAILKKVSPPPRSAASRATASVVVWTTFGAFGFAALLLALAMLENALQGIASNFEFDYRFNYLPVGSAIQDSQALIASLAGLLSLVFIVSVLLFPIAMRLTRRLSVFFGLLLRRLGRSGLMFASRVFDSRGNEPIAGIAFLLSYVFSLFLNGVHSSNLHDMRTGFTRVSPTINEELWVATFSLAVAFTAFTALSILSAVYLRESSKKAEYLIFLRIGDSPAGYGLQMLLGSALLTLLGVVMGYITSWATLRAALAGFQVQVEVYPPTYGILVVLVVVVAIPAALGGVLRARTADQANIEFRD